VFVLDFEKEKSTFIKKRTSTDIWKNLYDFPLIESKNKVSQNDMLQKISELYDIPVNQFTVSKSKEYKHILTHRIIYARFYVIKLPDQQMMTRVISNFEKGFINVTEHSVSNYPIPRLIDKFLKENNIFSG
jgi:A/G-specific adenine glycosylase